MNAPVATTGRLIGYVRVSTKDQDVTPQREALVAAGVEARDIFADEGVSGAKTSRPGFDSMLAHIQPGDTLIITKLDRMGRNTGHVVALLHDLTERGIAVRSIDDGLDTSTVMSRAMMQMLAVFAGLEREFNRERTAHALKSKADRGIKGGRPRALDTKGARAAVRMAEDGDTAADIAKTLKISVPTVYRYLAAARAEREQA